MDKLYWVISSCVLIVAVLVIRAVLGRRMGAGLRYALWALVLLRLILPVSIGESFLSVQNFTPEMEYNRPPAVTVTQAVNAAPDAAPVQAPAPQNENMNISYSMPDAGQPASLGMSTENIVTLIWVCGCALLAAYFAFVNLRFYFKLRARRMPLGTDCPLTVYSVEDITSSCLFGLIRPSIYVSAQTAKTGEELRHVLSHELAHYRHGDSLWAFCRCAVLALHWYNPLVWCAAVMSCRDSELFADAGAIRSLGESQRESYGTTLIKLSAGRRRGASLLCAATTMSGGKKALRERVTMIAKNPQATLAVILTVAVLAAVAVGCAFTGGKDSESDGGADVDGTSAAPAMIEADADIPALLCEFQTYDYIEVDAGDAPIAGELIPGFMYDTDIECRVCDEEEFTAAVSGSTGQITLRRGGKELILYGGTDCFSLSENSRTAYYHASRSLYDEFLILATFAVDEHGSLDISQVKELAGREYAELLERGIVAADIDLTRSAVSFAVLSDTGHPNGLYVYNDTETAYLGLFFESTQFSGEIFLDPSTGKIISLVIAEYGQDGSNNLRDLVDVDTSAGEYLIELCSYWGFDSWTCELSGNDSLYSLDHSIRFSSGTVSATRYISFAGDGSLGVGLTFSLGFGPLLTDAATVTAAPLLVPMGDTVFADLDGNGADEEICLSLTDYDFEHGQSLNLTINNEVIWYGVDGLNVESPDGYWYAICDMDAQDGMLEIAIMDHGPSSDEQTHFLRFESMGALSYVGTVEGLLYDSNSGSFGLEFDGAGNVSSRFRLSVLHTWYAYCSYSLDGGSLSLVPQDIYYSLPASYKLEDGTEKTSHTLLKDIVAYSQMDDDSERYVLPAGEEISLFGTDNREWVFASDSAGNEFWMRLGEGGTVVETPEGMVFGGDVIDHLNYAD